MASHSWKDFTSGEALALDLIRDIERHKVENVGAAIRAIRAKATNSLPRPEQAVSALTESIVRGDDVSSKLGEAVLSLWPNTPTTILQELTSWAPEDTESLVFKRRKRRAISKAKKVLVHMFAGDSRRQIEKLGAACGYEVISIGEEEDLTSTQTYGFLLRKAAEGALDALWCAPPCGTNSLCRFVQPGPRPLRGIWEYEVGTTGPQRVRIIQGAQSG